MEARNPGEDGRGAGKTRSIGRVWGRFFAARWILLVDLVLLLGSCLCLRVELKNVRPSMYWTEEMKEEAAAFALADPRDRKDEGYKVRRFLGRKGEVNVNWLQLWFGSRRGISQRDLEEQIGPPNLRVERYPDPDLNLYWLEEDNPHCPSMCLEYEFGYLAGVGISGSKYDWTHWEY